MPVAVSSVFVFFGEATDIPCVGKAEENWDESEDLPAPWLFVAFGNKSRRNVILNVRCTSGVVFLKRIFYVLS